MQLFASASQVGRAKTEEEKAEALKQTFAAVETLEAAFKECSQGKPFFGGDSVGYLDIVLGPIVPLAYVGEVRFGIKLFDGTRSPLLEAWVERFAMMDAAKAILPDVDKLIEYRKAKACTICGRDGRSRKELVKLARSCECHCVTSLHNTDTQSYSPLVVF